MPKRGRKQTNPVHNHFKFDDITSTSICYVAIVTNQFRKKQYKSIPIDFNC